MLEYVEPPVLGGRRFAGVRGFVVFEDNICAGDSVGLSGEEPGRVIVWFLFLLIVVLGGDGDVTCAFV